VLDYDQAAQDGALRVTAGPGTAAKLRHLPGVVGLSSAPPGDVSALSGKVGILATGSITGVVTAEGGTPLAGIEVCAYSGPWDWGVCTTTDGGTYSLDGLTSSRYQVLFADYSGTYGGEYYNNKSEPPGSSVSVTGGSTTPNINAVLAASGHITGVVTSEDTGDVLSGITACVDTDLGDWSADTDANGLYDIAGVSPGSHAVRFYDSNGDYAEEYFDNKISSSTATPVVVTAGDVTRNINAALSADGHISGMVTNETYDELEDINVTAYRYDGNDWEEVGFIFTGIPSGGAYDMGGLGAGTYKVQFHDDYGYYAPQHYDLQLSRDAADPVDVTAGSGAEDIDGMLYEGGHITGTVTDAAGDAPLEGIGVEAYRYNNGGWDWVDYTYTDSTGRYDITLPSGTYRVKFVDWWWGEYAERYYGEGATPGEATSVDLTAPNTVAAIDAALDRASILFDLPLICK
jgi:hypothetical protein